MNLRYFVLEERLRSVELLHDVTFQIFKPDSPALAWDADFCRCLLSVLKGDDAPPRHPPPIGCILRLSSYLLDK